MHHVASDIEEEVGNKKKNNKREFDVDEEVGNKEKTRRQKESSPRGVAATAEAVKDPTSDDKEDSFDDLNTTEPGQATSESELDSHFQKNSPKKQHKTTVDSVTCDTSKSSKSYKSDPSYTSEKKAVDSSSSQSATSSKRKKFSLWESMKRRKWHCLCCITLLLFLVVVAIVGFVVLSAYQESKDASNESSYAIVETDIPSMYPSMAPTQQMTHNSSDAPSTTPSEQVFAGGLQIGGVDPNEYCNKPCPEGEDCGRCAWCNADRGFLPNTIFSYYCHEEPISIELKCFIGDKRIQLHNSYVALIADCTSGFKAWPQLKEEDTTEDTVCVDEATCMKKFLELPGSMLVTETCQDKIGGTLFGYDWEINAPREGDCPASGKFASALAQRCCNDGVAYCNTFFGSGMEGDVTLTQQKEPSLSISN